MTDYGYAIDPRPAELGGGWRLRLLENGEEVGGGVFPLSPYLSAFPATDEATEREMAEKAAYEDALPRRPRGSPPGPPTRNRPFWTTKARPTICRPASPLPKS